LSDLSLQVGIMFFFFCTRAAKQIAKNAINDLKFRKSLVL